MLEWFVQYIYFILGLCVGSFLNMAIYRMAKNYGLISKKQKSIFKQFPKNKSQKINKNRSYCDYCGRQLFWYENIPVLSWVVQKGKTRCCGNPLPWEYPIVEFGTGVAFLIFNLKFLIFNQFSMIQFLIGLVMISLLIFSLVFDLKYMILPDVSNLLLVGLSILLILIKGGHIGPPVQYLLSGVGSLSFFFLLNRIKIRGSEAMGMGDVKFSLFMGLFLGFPNILVAIYFAFVVGAVVSLVMLALGIVKKEKPIPFGPFLIVGSVVAKIWGEIIINKFYGVLF